MLTYTVKTIMMAPYLIACSMQYVSTVSMYPGSCKTCFFRIPVFGGKVFLIFPIIYLTADLKVFCIIGLSDLINSLIFANIYLDDIFTHFGGFFPFSWVSWLLNFIETRRVSFWPVLTMLPLQITLKLHDQSCQNQFIC